MVSRAGVVAIATRYGLDGQEIESRWGGEIFRTRPEWLWAPPRLLWFAYRVYISGKKRQGSGVDHPPPSSAGVKERVELYLYSPFRFSLQVTGRISLLLPVTLPLLFEICSADCLRTRSVYVLPTDEERQREREISFHTHTHTHTHKRDDCNSFGIIRSDFRLNDFKLLEVLRPKLQISQPKQLHGLNENKNDVEKVTSS